MKNLLVTAVLIVSSIFPLIATHNLAGSISAKPSDPTNPNTYQVTLTTYTDPAPGGVDRCSATIEVWTTGANPTQISAPGMEDIPRQNGTTSYTPASDCNLMGTYSGVVVKGTVKENIYIGEFTFPGPGNYALWYQDVARHGSVINIDNPEEQAFFVETILHIPAPPSLPNSTPTFLNMPLENACLGTLYTHNPGGYDFDGDSLAYSLVPCFQYDPANPPPTICNGYKWPDDPVFGNSSMTIDSLTGLISWDNPPQEGIYNIAYEVKEWRNGQLLGKIRRDMAIWVIDCNNKVATIELGSGNELYTYPGKMLSFQAEAIEPDPGDSLYLELNNAGLGNNGIFSPLVSQTATVSGKVHAGIDSNSFTFNDLPVGTLNDTLAPPDTIRADFSWMSICDEVGKIFQVDIRAHDNFSYVSLPTTTSLDANKALRVHVLPPPPTDLQVSMSNWGAIRLDWTEAICGNAVRYYIYRRIGEGNWEQASDCSGTPEDDGYTFIGDVAGWDSPTFFSLPEGLVDSTTVCFRVTAAYGAYNNPYFESCATEEVCFEGYTTPIDGLTETKDWSIYPNPASEMLNIEMPHQLAGFNGEILDLQGRSIQQFNSKSSFYNLNISNLPKGLYLVRIQTTDGKVAVKKIVKE